MVLRAPMHAHGIRTASEAYLLDLHQYCESQAPVVSLQLERQEGALPSWFLDTLHAKLLSIQMREEDCPQVRHMEAQAQKLHKSGVLQPLEETLGEQVDH